MRTIPPLRLVVFAAAVTGGAVLLGVTGWVQPDRVLEFSGVILAAILTSAAAILPSKAEDRGMMPPSFVIDFSALLFFGGREALFVAAAGITTRWLADSDRARPLRSLLLNAVTVMTATAAASLAHGALGGVPGHFTWPWQGVPIAGAVVAYCFVKSTSAEVIAPLFNREAFNRSWPMAILRNCPNYFLGASLAVGLVEIVNHGRWDVMPVAAVPLYCAYRMYCSDLNRLEHDYRCREIIESLNQGMSVIDSDGRVMLWNDDMERITGCPRERALGRPLAGAVPVLGETPLPRAVQDAMRTRRPRTLTHVRLPSASDARILDVKILPVAGGLTLLWDDITERTHAEQALKRNEERLTLAAEGANDGLWEWDLRTQAFYVSGRWKAMIGLPAAASIARPEEWLGRVHADDVIPLKASLDAHLAGTTGHFQYEHRIRHEDGTYRRFLCRGLAARGTGERATRIAGSLTDTTEQGSAQEQLRTAGSRDSLTGLCNRAVFVERLGHRLAEFKHRKGGGDWFAALYLDLDRFKVVNDSLGHMVGDELLIAVSRRLESCLRQGDALARLGGDEFAILLNAIGDPQQANAVAFRIQKALSDPFSIGGREVFTSASIGIAFGLGAYDNPDEIMRDADTAMYHAKSRGKARHELFDADMHARVRDRLGMENDLRHAINNNDFEVHYQPIVSLASRMCVGFESLIRWTRNGQAVSPVTFIPMAEELGLIEPLGTWVLQQACRTFADWQRQFPDARLDCITVNVSSRQLSQQNFLLIVEQAVLAAQLKPCDLRLEITETALMDSPNAAAALLRELRDFGVKIYLDDFGTGYSSLSHLHKLPVDALKIDRSFVRSLVISDRPAIVESILALARTLKTSVVAEGIESEDQARELERLGCTHAQGFLFSRPLSVRAAEQLLAANQPLGPKATHQSDAFATKRNEAEGHQPSTVFEGTDRIAV
jgi:diguanylate cyclase (GGDEF)-like protein/PAS domain S-box-containing protein